MGKGVTTLRLEEDLGHLLDEWTDVCGVKRTAVIRQALNEYFHLPAIPKEMFDYANPLMATITTVRPDERLISRAAWLHRLQREQGR